MRQFLVRQFFGDGAAIFGEFGHHLFVQPYVHFRAAILGAGIAQLFSQLLAVGERRVQADQLHQIDD